MKIQNKLFIFLFGFSLMLVTALVLLMQWSIGKGMVEYVISKEVETLQPVLTQITDEYKVEKNWQSLAGKHRRFHHLITQQLAISDFDVEKNFLPVQDITDKKRLNKLRFEAKSANRPPPHHENFAHFPPRPPKTEAHYALLDADENVIVGKYFSTLDYKKIAIEVDNSVVGYFAVSKRNQLTQGYEVEF
ncbi:MAG: two-component system sensor histidine kinase BaeS, partial [Psychroserpens sp.]